MSPTEISGPQGGRVGLVRGAADTRALRLRKRYKEAA